MRSALVIGIGNSLRSDDGAGIRAAEQLRVRHPSLDVRTAQQLTPEYAEVLSAHAAVVILDASVGINEVRVTQVKPARGASPRGTHASPLEDILTLSHSLYGHAPDEVILIEIPGVNFEFREEISPVTEDAIEQAIDVVERFLLRNDL